MRSLPWYLESNFIKRIARLQRGPFKEPARAPMNLVAALHRSSCRLGLVRVVGPKLTALAASATFLSLLAYLLRLTAQVVQSEEVHRHVCAQHASTRDQTTACSTLRSILNKTKETQFCRRMFVISLMSNIVTLMVLIDITKCSLKISTSYFSIFQSFNQIEEKLHFSKKKLFTQFLQLYIKHFLSTK